MHSICIWILFPQGGSIFRYSLVRGDTNSYNNYRRSIRKARIEEACLNQWKPESVLNRASNHERLFWIAPSNRRIACPSESRKEIAQVEESKCVLQGHRSLHLVVYSVTDCTMLPCTISWQTVHLFYTPPDYFTVNYTIADVHTSETISGAQALVGSIVSNYILEV